MSAIPAAEALFPDDGETSPRGAPTPRGFLRFLKLAPAVAVIVLLIWAGERWLWRKPPTSPPSRAEIPAPDPRLNYRGPFRNIHPDVRYVGDGTCTGCHRTEVDGFHRHPMGRSIVPVAQLAASQRYDRKANNPFEALRSRFSVERRGARVWHREERFGPQGKLLAAAAAEVEYAIGSGRRGHSYFTTRGGFLFQTPVSWFSQKEIWDLSPGFRNASPRPVLPGCVFCHAGGARPVEHSLNRYEEPIFRPAAISCERCHGPGGAHVKARRADEPLKGKTDFTIVNPKRLPPALRESVCQQCHLEGEVRILRRGRGLFDFRPGLPLQLFWRVYVAEEGIDKERRAVSQVEQMYQSKCFKASRGRMGCATCHEVHDAPPAGAARVASYRKTCLQCHEKEHPCSLDKVVRLEVSKEDSCIDCHMRRLPNSDIAHTAATDHTIPRKARIEDRAPRARRPSLPENPLLPFPPETQVADKEADRDLGMALVKAAREKGAKYRPYLPQALDLLDRAREKFPGDLPLLLAAGECLGFLEQNTEALAVFERILACAPKHGTALYGAGRVSFQLGRLDASLKFWERLLSENPGHMEGRLYQCVILAGQKKYREASAGCRQLLLQQPLTAEAWVVLAYCHEKAGRPELAEKASKQADALETPASRDFRSRFSSFVERP